MLLQRNIVNKFMNLFTDEQITKRVAERLVFSVQIIMMDA